MRPDRWEHGSDFHETSETGPSALPWRDARLVGSGRDAFRLLLSWGKGEGWRRVFVPLYYCDDVTRSIVTAGLPLARYDDSPERLEPPLASIDAGEGDAIVVVNYFGLRGAPSGAAPRGAIVIEDHSHDPLSEWAFGSSAEYAVASLRKWLPLPDGGVVWSPRARALPPDVALTPAHAAAACDRREAMLLKARYLAGEDVAKSAFRARAIAGEHAIGAGATSGITAGTRARLQTLPTVEWRETRRANFTYARRELAGARGVTVLPPAANAVPYAVTLCFESQHTRDRVRQGLIDANIYPAILWPQDRPSLADRLLMVHCDARYAASDMERVLATLRSLLDGVE